MYFLAKVLELEQRQATTSAVVRLVHVGFLLETYVKDILSGSTKTDSNRVRELVS